MKEGRLSSTYPDDFTCIRILGEAGCPKRVIVHCCTVREMAVHIADICAADRQLVSAGALLHDLGRCRDMGIRHAIIGATMAEQLGLPEETVEIIRRHIGAGLDEDEARELGLPPGDYIPSTLEEKIVAHADNLTSDNHFVPVQWTVKRLMEKSRYRGAERVVALHNELSSLCGIDLNILVERLGPHPKLSGPCGSL